MMIFHNMSRQPLFAVITAKGELVKVLRSQSTETAIDAAFALYGPTAKKAKLEAGWRVVRCTVQVAT